MKFASRVVSFKIEAQNSIRFECRSRRCSHIPVLIAGTEAGKQRKDSLSLLSIDFHYNSYLQAVLTNRRQRRIAGRKTRRASKIDLFYQSEDISVHNTVELDALGRSANSKRVSRVGQMFVMDGPSSSDRLILV